MILRAAVNAAALAIVLGNPPLAIAQTPSTERAPTAQTATPLPGQILVQDANTILAKGDLIGQTVYAPDKAKIGSISDLILTKDGRSVEGFVIGVGGFLGIGEKGVAMKIDRLTMAPAADGTMQLTMDAKKEELTNTPTFKSTADQAAEKAAEQRAREAPAQRPTPKAN